MSLSLTDIDVHTLGGLPLHREAPAAPTAAPAHAPTRPGGLSVRVRGLVKRYGTREVLQQIDLQLAPGEFVAIVGRSGCGKSTLLRHLAALETPSEGEIRLDDEPLGAQAPQAVRIMFQDARLLPWKRVLDNVALGLEGDDARERARAALAAVGLADRADEWPAVLSGGQRQRVALARALVHRPRLLLLDEPLGALDALTRIEMHQLIERLWLSQGFSALLVTHDVSEAVALADRVILIENHRVVLDEAVPLPRSRSRTAPGFAALEERVLRRVLQQPDTPDPADSRETATPRPWSEALRFAV